MLQLSPTIPLETPQGRAQAHFVIDYGPEAHLLYVCFLDANGECWTFQNAQVRLQANPTMRPDWTDGKPGVGHRIRQTVDNSSPNADMRPADVAQRMAARLRRTEPPASRPICTNCGAPQPASKIERIEEALRRGDDAEANAVFDEDKQAPPAGIFCKGSLRLGTACRVCERCKEELRKIKAAVASNTGEPHDPSCECQRCHDERIAIHILRDIPRTDKELAKANQQRAQQEEMLKKEPPEEDKPTFKRPPGAPSTWAYHEDCRCEFCREARGE